jgi:hypothetical protein
MKPAILTSLLVLLAACVTRQDVSNDARFATDYVLGATYRVQNDLAVRRLDNLLALFPPKRSSDAEGTVRQGANFVGLAPSGTRLVVTKFVLEKNPEAGNTVSVWGRCTDGPVMDTPVLLTFVSRQHFQTNVWASVPLVNTNFLQLVNKP